MSYPTTIVDVPVAPGQLAAPDTAIVHHADQVRFQLRGGRIWHVSSTATGGGVAELLRGSMVRHQVLGLPAQWLVPEAEPEFFELTKRIHHGLHGRPVGNGFGLADRELYRVVTARSAQRMLPYMRAGDVVILHDPQTLGAAPHLIAAGMRVAWRCHIGTGSTSAMGTWELLRVYLEQVSLAIFTLTDFAPPFLPLSRVQTILPSIDPDSPKNRSMDPTMLADLLAAAGLTGHPNGQFARPGVRLGHTIHSTYLPADAQVVTQVSRWDPLKDMTGVLHAFVDHIAPASTAHLVLAGPDPADIPDDPEGARIYADVLRLRELVPESIRQRIHLVVLSLRDFAFNALVVNAIQRRSTVVVQKSLEEGFGLTVTEAMWKRRPIVASRAGGLTAQIEDRVNGLLVDPADLPGFGQAVRALLADGSYANSLGESAHRRCESQFLADRELTDYLQTYLTLLGA